MWVGTNGMQDCGPSGDAGTNFTEKAAQTSKRFDDDDWNLLWGDDANDQEMNAQPICTPNSKDHEVVIKVNTYSTTYLDI